MILRPDWSVPDGVRAVASTREGGVSLPPFQTLNLGDHVGDDPAHVAENRRRLGAWLGEGVEPGWIRQVHGTHVVELPVGEGQEADAATATEPGVACAILTADCLPVLFCDRDGQRVAAAHAGWRGLLSGVLEATVSRFESPRRVLAWMGPAIGPGAFEVGPEVYEAFVASDAEHARAFSGPGVGGRRMANLYELARYRLNRCGVSSVAGGGRCTFRDAQTFYSYRRSGQTGRMASLIWIEPAS
ncbi:hypothetical protein C8D92_109183 [Tamilnaduibacter salinus]|uniref:Purine nucleoside phosphorylase n=1 Tax=Tamilnaduibacter salinus TaxID=1484056 RepID=A0A2U1CU94_9GAMM|nr:peptidoglycan editing factor PgeF [Tamilnaduibacter salinus]PVY70430.1 hypothetical protein C8D92_109183 [Tamilnaduibacter salinus]